MNDTVLKHFRTSGTGIVLLLSLLLFYLPPALFMLEDNVIHRSTHYLGLVMATFYAASFLINYFLLVPWMLKRPDRRAGCFIINALLIIVAMAFVPLWSELTGSLRLHPPGRPGETAPLHFLPGYIRFILRDGIMMVLAAGLAYAVRLGQEKSQIQRRALQLDAERRQIELRNLKAQLNPHFLFNSLNNIYALISFAPEKAQEALHDLSSMLRFMIYDASAPTVPLSKELQFITDYVELMRLRLGDGCRISLSVDGGYGPSLHIAPLLYLTLVENAFKHSAPSTDGHFIDISIFPTPAELVCRTHNSVHAVPAPTGPGERQGVGLENVRRQLDLLYPGRSSLIVEETAGSYTAEIRIDLAALQGKATHTNPLPT